MGKQRREQPQDSIFADNPFLDGLFEWMDSPEGQKSIAVRDVLWNLLEHAQPDAKQRKLIWPDAERLDLEQSIQRVQTKYPDFPRDEVEEFLLNSPAKPPALPERIEAVLQLRDLGHEAIRSPWGNREALKEIAMSQDQNH